MRRSIKLLALVLSCALTVAAADLPQIANGSIDQAIQQFSREAQSSPNDWHAHIALARTYYAVGRWDDAIKAGEKAASLNPNCAECQSWLARMYGDKAEDSGPFGGLKYGRKAGEALDRAAQLAPNDPQVLSALAEFNISAPGMIGGSKDRAQNLADRLAKIDPAESHWVLAQLAQKDKRWEDAEREFKASIDASNGAANYWLEYGKFLWRRGRNPEMEQAVLKAVASPRKKSNSLYEAGNLLQRAGRNFPDSIKYLRAYLDQANKSEDAPAFRAHYLLGTVLERQGDKPAAIKEYRQALSLASDFKPAQEALRVGD
jgi:tetratricopeptide (TPR) repeat protein